MLGFEYRERGKESQGIIFFLKKIEGGGGGGEEGEAHSFDQFCC